MSEELKKDIIISVKTDTKDAEQGVDNLKKKIEDVANTPVDKSFKTLKQELKEAQNEAQRLFQQFGAGSKQFTEAASRVADLRNEIDEVNLSFKNFNPDNKLQSLSSMAKGAVGALQGVTGAMAFLGVESDNAAETMAKLQGLMAFSDALNSIGDIKDSFKNFASIIQNSTVLQKANVVTTNLASGAMRTLGISANTTSFAFQALKTAIAATGIGLLVVGISALLPIISNWISNTEEAEAAQRNLESAVRSLNAELEGQLEAIDYYGKKQLQDAKLRGASAEEQFGITRKTKLEEFNFLQRNEEEKRKLYNQALKNEKLSGEELTKIQEEYNKAKEATQKKGREIDIADGDERVRRADEQRKKEKESADKAKADADKRAAERKSALDKQKAETKQSLEEIAKINADAQKAINESGLSEHAKELAQLQYDFDEKKKKFIKYGKDVATITKLFNIEKAAIDKKYADEATQFILEQTGSEFEIQKAAINKQFDEQLKNASQFSDKLIEIRNQKLKELDDKKAQQDALNAANTNATQAETTLINTQVENRILETDDPETRKEKLQAINQAEVDVENAAYQAKLISLKGNQAEIEKATAEHNAKLVDLADQKAQDEKALDDAVKEAKLNNLAVLSGSLSKAGELFEQGTVANKAISVATASIDTYTGANKALAAYPPPFNFIAAAGVVAAGLANVKKIVSTKVGKKDTTSGSAAAAPVTTAPSINSTVLNNANAIQDVRVVNQQESVVKAYVSQRDLQSAEDKSQFINKLSSF